MMYHEFTVGGETYKLRLTTRNIVALEKQIGMNPLSIFGDGDTLPQFSVMVAILHASLQDFNHGISLDKAYDLFDKYLEEGNTLIDFFAVILDIYKVSGLMKNEKN